MNHENQHNPYAAIASDATREAMLAKREFEKAAQQRKVRLLTEQAQERVSELRNRIYDVESALRNTTDTFEFAYPAGAFLRDTETIDHLLATLSNEVEALANMTAAEEASDRLMAQFDTKIEQVRQHGQDGQDGHAYAMPAVGGAYL